MKSTVRKASIIVAVMSGILANSHAANLTLDPALSAPGGRGEVSVRLSGGTAAIGGLSGRLNLPEGVRLAGVARGQATPGTWRTDFYQAEGSVSGTFVGYDATPVSASSGELVRLVLEVSPDAQLGTYPIAWGGGGAVLSNASGTAMLSAGVQGGQLRIVTETQALANRVLDVFDSAAANPSTGMTLQEFLAAFPEATEADFDALDKDNNGVLTKQELEEIVGEGSSEGEGEGEGEGSGEGELEGEGEFVILGDINEDGEISSQEVRDIIRAFLTEAPSAAICWNLGLSNDSDCEITSQLMRDVIANFLIQD